MSNAGDKERLWSAYLDGELTAAEAARFDQSLTPDERARLMAEMKVEAQINERLGAEVTCPDAVWQNAVAAVRQNEITSDGIRPATRWIAGLSAVAAALIVATVFIVPRYSPPALASVLSVDQYSCVNDIRVPEAEVNEYLRQRSFFVRIENESSIPTHHKSFLAGVATREHKGEEFVEVYFGCCRRPVKVIVTPYDSKLAGLIRDAAKRSKTPSVQKIDRVGGYIAVLVGEHPAGHVVGHFYSNR